MAAKTGNVTGTASGGAATDVTSAQGSAVAEGNANARGRVGFVGLYALVVSAMVGGGVFSLPQNMAQYAAPGAQLIAWLITGVGMWFIVDMFRLLTAAKPELSDGLYTYAERGFGRFIGFLVAYGYWICNCFSIIAYGVLVMSTLNIFFPGSFESGNNLASVIGASVILWIMYIIAKFGIKTGATINVVGTICKIVPVLVFIVALLTIFKGATFVHAFWGTASSGEPLKFSFSGVGSQVSNSMLVTLWLFIGMEGAVVLSGSARSPKDVSRATTAGFTTVLVLYVLVSLLPLGVYSEQDIGGMSNPSMSVIMQRSFGTWGEVMVNIGVIVSVLFSWLVWLIMISQMPLYAARDGIFPRVCLRTNKHGAPTTGLLWSALVCQALFIACYFVQGDAWNVMISITSVMSMPCYLLCCLYLCKIAFRERDLWKTRGISRTHAIVTGVVSVLFALFLVESAGLQYLMIACVIFAIGLPIFIIARFQHNPGIKVCELLSRPGWVLFALIIVVGICGIFYTLHAGPF
ncbi:basic amino acid/polyamine antiporter [Bifidobacterium canis]|uniref:Arginine:agmatine antiporter n=1 Tax=Bifidobacterium canis TaxID=2610880 RepID=A0A7K1J7T1_9BIFI|nr:arginine:agmatine antiporter [Bifidobacterium canis]